MLKRLFGRNKPQVAPPSLPPQWTRPAWQSAKTAYLDYFNLHLHGLDLDTSMRALEAKYLTTMPTEPAIVVRQQGEWTSAYFARTLVASVGFNKLAHEIAREHRIWLIGYRVYGAQEGEQESEQGIDVHYFHGDDHVDGLSVGQGELEREPSDAATFAPLADVSGVIPRPQSLHPLDFHFGLLEALGIQDAALTFEEALRRYEMGALEGERLLPRQ